MNDTQTRFLQLVTGPALQSERASAIPAAITIAQAILESGWGQSQLFLQANNPFGIKASHTITDPYQQYTAPTQEYTADQWKTITATFQKFQNLGQAFQRHAQLLLTQGYGLLQTGLLDTEPIQDRCERVAKALQAGRYATDPQYASKLMELVNEFHLYDGSTLAGWSSQEQIA